MTSYTTEDLDKLEQQGPVTVSAPTQPQKQTFSTEELDAIEGVTPTEFQPPDESLIATAGHYVSRFGKQLWNSGVANLIKTVKTKSAFGEMDNLMNSIKIIEKQKKAGTYVPLPYEGVGIDKIPVEGRDEVLRLRGEQFAALLAAGKQSTIEQADKSVPGFEVSPSTNIGETVTDTVAGVTAFVGQLAILRKAMPTVNESLLWEIQAKANGAKDGQGLLMFGLFSGAGTAGGGLASKIAGEGVVKGAERFAVKTAPQSLAMGGVTAVEGGTPTEIAIAAAIPPVLGATALLPSKGGKVTPKETEKPTFQSEKTVDETIADQYGVDSIKTKQMLVRAEIRFREIKNKESENRTSKDDTELAFLSRERKNIISLIEDATSTKPQSPFIANLLSPKDLKASAASGQVAHQLADTLGMTDYDYRVLAKEVTKKDSTTKMTVEESNNFLAELQYRTSKKALNINTQEESYLTSRVNGRGKQGDVLEYFRNQLGEFPDDPVQRKEVNYLFKELVNSAQKIEARESVAEQRGVSIGKTGFLSSARYILGDLELRTFIPFRQRFSDIVSSGRKAGSEVASDWDGVYKRLGGHLKNSLSFHENKLIKEWLDEADPAIKESIGSKMNEKTKNLAVEAEGLLQGKYADWAREARWINWQKLGGEMPPDLKALSPKDLKPIVDAGLKAEAGGTLKEWIHSQTWGTRKSYFMREADLDNLLDNLVPSEEVFRKGTNDKIAPAPSSVNTRTGKGKLVEGNVVANIVNHATRLKTFIEAGENLTQFWKDVKRADLSSPDVKLVGNMVKATLGRIEFDKIDLTIAKTNRFFWRGYFMGAGRTIYFGLRQLAQLVALGPSQVKTSEWLKSTYKIAQETMSGLKDPERVADFETNWLPKISEKGVLSKEWMYKDIADMPNSINIERIKFVADKVGDLAISTDSITRAVLWPVLYDVGKRNVLDYRSGKISFSKLLDKTETNTLHTTQRLELVGLLKRGDDRTFVNKLAEYKTENAFFRYERSLRAPVELKPAHQAIFGLITYPRGVLEVIIRGGVKPLVDGIQSKNYAQAKSGLMVITRAAVGHYLADQLCYQITGKHSYNLLGSPLAYGLLSPGIGVVSSFMDAIGELEYQREQGRKTYWDIFDKMAGSSVNGLFYFAPVDLLLNFYESQNNVKKVTYYKLAKKHLNNWFSARYGKSFDYADRTNWEKFSHTLFGADPQPEENEPLRSN